MVLIGVVNNLSIGALFLSGILPGLLVVPGLLGLAYWHAVRGGPAYRSTEPFSLRRLGAATVDAIPAFGLAVIILGGILGGVFTPTEAAGVAVVYSLAVGAFVYRELTWGKLRDVFLRATAFTSGILILVAAASIFGWLIANAGVPAAIDAWFRSNVSSPWVFLLVLNIFLMILGMFMESLAIILLLSPVFIPIGIGYGLEPVHIALVMVFNCAIGMITPPFGGAVFVAATIAQRPFLAVSRRIIGPWSIMTAVLLLITYVPAISLALPKAAGFLK